MMARRILAPRSMAFDGLTPSTATTTDDDNITLRVSGINVDGTGHVLGHYANCIFSQRHILIQTPPHAAQELYVTTPGNRHLCRRFSPVSGAPRSNTLRRRADLQSLSPQSAQRTPERPHGVA
jgi:hypothetical protein